MCFPVNFEYLFHRTLLVASFTTHFFIPPNLYLQSPLSLSQIYPLQPSEILPMYAREGGIYLNVFTLQYIDIYIHIYIYKRS